MIPMIDNIGRFHGRKEARPGLNGRPHGRETLMV